MDAKQELTWFIIIIIVVGVLWISVGGLKSPTKNSPVIQAVPGGTATTSQEGGWFSFLFPWPPSENGSQSNMSGNNSSPTDGNRGRV